MKPLVLISSRDPEFYLLFSHILDVDGFASELAGSVREALRFAAERKPLAIILDVQPSGHTGTDLCARLKKQASTRNIPVAALVAPGGEAQHLGLLKAGVDEIFVRPFAPVKLLGFLHSKIARQSSANVKQGKRQLRYGGIEINEETFRVHCRGQEVYLPRIEFRLLRLLLESPGTVFSREELATAGWLEGLPADLRSVDVHIARLRKALKKVLHQDVIRTVRSAGYALEIQEQENGALGHTPA